MRAQTAAEFLVTYGWAILIISVIMVALFASGFFNPNNYASQQCILSSGFACLSYFSGSDGSLLINIQQATSAPVNITAIGCSQNTIGESVTKTTFSPAANQIFLPIGGNFSTVIQCYNKQGAAYQGTVGGVFSGYLYINYVNDFTQIPGIATGSISVKTSSQSVFPH
jgi:hypothetical protein